MALVTVPKALPVQDNRPNHIVLVQSYANKPVKHPIRLTRRGRRVVAILALLPILVAFLLLGIKVANASDTSTDSSLRPSTATIVVQPGQSLWDVATAVDQNADPREIIWVIQQLNGMKTSEVLAGQELIVPEN